jgi:hypothetical protein
LLSVEGISVDIKVGLKEKLGKMDGLKGVGDSMGMEVGIRDVTSEDSELLGLLNGVSVVTAVGMYNGSTIEELDGMPVGVSVGIKVRVKDGTGEGCDTSSMGDTVGVDEYDGDGRAVEVKFSISGMDGASVVRSVGENLIMLLGDGENSGVGGVDGCDSETVKSVIEGAPVGDSVSVVATGLLLGFIVFISVGMFDGLSDIT